jgi:DNA-binding NarL/FixJ family response regulator
MIDVLIALEEPLLQMGARAALEEAGDFRVVGTVAEREKVEEEALALKPDVVLLDVHFQKADRELIPRLTEMNGGMKVLVLVDHSDEECSIRSLLADPQGARLSEEALEHLDECCLTSLRSSARGCVARTADPQKLVHAVRTVAAGEIAAAPWLSAILKPGTSTPPRDAPSPISARELEVISLVAKGDGNKEIAKKLGIREQTVKNHLASIMQKLGAKSRLEVGIQAVRQHLEASGEPKNGNGAG